MRIKCGQQQLLPSLSSVDTSAEELFTGKVSPARRDFSWTKSGFSAHKLLKQEQKNLPNLSAVQTFFFKVFTHQECFLKLLMPLTVRCQSASVDKEWLLLRHA